MPTLHMLLMRPCCILYALSSMLPMCAHIAYVMDALTLHISRRLLIASHWRDIRACDAFPVHPSPRPCSLVVQETDIDVAIMQSMLNSCDSLKGEVRSIVCHCIVRQMGTAWCGRPLEFCGWPTRLRSRARDGGTVRACCSVCVAL